MTTRIFSKKNYINNDLRFKRKVKRYYCKRCGCFISRNKKLCLKCVERKQEIKKLYREGIINKEKMNIMLIKEGFGLNGD